MILAKHSKPTESYAVVQKNKLQPGGKLLRNLPACFCFHASAMIKICTYLYFHSCKPQKWRK